MAYRDFVLALAPAPDFYWRLGELTIRKNECTNPSFENDVATWDPPSGGTLTRVAGFGAAGSWAGEMTRPAVTNNDVSCFWPNAAHPACAPGEKIAVLGSLKIGPANTASGTGPRVAVQFDDGSNTWGLPSTFSNAIAWPAVGGTATVSVVATAPANAVKYRTRWLGNTSGSQVVDIIWDAILVEKAAAVGSYFDGSTSGFGWQGTPHASTSVQALADATANARGGVPIGGFTLAQAALIASDADKALLLDGVNGRLASSYQLFEGGHSFTLAWWMKATTTPNDGTLAMWGGATSGNEVYCRMNPSTGGITFTPNRSAANPAATWLAAVTGPKASHLYVLTFSDPGDVAELYVDGVSKGTRAVAAGMSGKNFMLGHDSVGGTFPGTFDEVAGWKDTILSASQIQQLYSRGLFYGAVPLGGSRVETRQALDSRAGTLALGGSRTELRKALDARLGAVPIIGDVDEIRGYDDHRFGAVPLDGASFDHRYFGTLPRTPRRQGRARVRTGPRGKVRG